MRAKSARGEIIAPTIYAASPQLIGKESSNAYVVTTETEARESVRKARQDGYDYLKITTNLKPEVYEAIVNEARKQTIQVIGHADSRFVGLTRALKAGQQIEHLDSYLEALLPESVPVKGSVSDIYLYNPKNWESLDYLDESKIPELARLTVQANPFWMNRNRLGWSCNHVGATGAEPISQRRCCLGFAAQVNGQLDVFLFRHWASCLQAYFEPPLVSLN
ncbi:MAG: hypothetical protein ACRD8U_08675 [Pyrinomonadaceae bacterium]